jgi:polyribonucleotide nucleotidyltransferase
MKFGSSATSAFMLLACYSAQTTSAFSFPTKSPSRHSASSVGLRLPRATFTTSHQSAIQRTKTTSEQQSLLSLKAEEHESSNEVDVIAAVIASVDEDTEGNNGEAGENAASLDKLLEDITADEQKEQAKKSENEVEVEEEEVEDPKEVMAAMLAEPVPERGFIIEETSDGPGGCAVHTLTVHMGAPGHPEPLVFETGKIGRQAAGSVTLKRGETVVYSTASRDNKPKETIDFTPLSVEYQERFSSVGLTSGGFNKRDGRPAEHEILTCRLIDRPLRPLIEDGWRHETQLLSWVLSYDGIRECDHMGITASAAALWISDIPLAKPVAAAVVGFIDGHLVINPTNDQMERSSLHLTIAGTKDAVLMIEGAADFLPESIMVEALKLGQGVIKVICEGLEALGEKVGKDKILDTIFRPPPGLQEAVDELMLERVDVAYAAGDTKDAHSANIKEMSKFIVETLKEDERFNGEEYETQIVSAIKGAFKTLLSKRMFHLAKHTQKRIDGRGLDEVRGIDIEAGFLPRVHGSALFTRGETQTIATATLGDSGMRQKIEKIEGMELKRFYLQYTFPPSCVGETGRVGAPGRREVGHGNLAERAILPALPSEKDFPYTIRVESLITESHGSSSMASVCGGILSLMDAGVPIARPVAGIAMGMLLENTKGYDSDDDAVIVSDILGSEDALGTMDFKVAGDKDGITTFQLDIKCEGLSIQTLERALEQARQGRLHILGEMSKTLDAPRDELPPTVPRLASFPIAEDSIGRVIGPGGKQIRAIIEDFQLTNMDVQEDGTVQISSMDTKMLKDAQAFVEELVKDGGGRGGGRGGGAGGKGGAREPKIPYAGPEPEEGKIYKGTITGIHDWGVFLEILPGAEDGSYPGLEGLCHVSELHTERVRNCEGFVRSMNSETFDVKLLGKNPKGQYQLSRRAVLQPNGPSGGGGRPRNTNSMSSQGDQRRREIRSQKTESTDASVSSPAAPAVTAVSTSSETVSE